MVEQQWGAAAAATSLSETRSLPAYITATWSLSPPLHSTAHTVTPALLSVIVSHNYTSIHTPAIPFIANISPLFLGGCSVRWGVYCGAVLYRLVIRSSYGDVA